MPLPPKNFKIDAFEFQHTPWGAFTAVNEWGEVAAEFGEDALALLVAGDFAHVVEGLSEGSGGAAVALKALMGYLTAEELGERVAHYMGLSKVHVRAGDEWLPLFGDGADAAAAAAGIDGWTLLQAAWHVVREGFGPLFDRLRSSVQRTAQAAARSPNSSASADPG